MDPDQPDQPEQQPATSTYRFATPIVVRVVGGLVVALAVLVVLAAVVVALAGWSVVVLAVVLAVGLLTVVGVAGWLRRGLAVVRLDAEGYVVRGVRGAGVTRARWADVVEAAAAHRAGTPVLELRLREGGTTTVPVAVLDADRDAFANDVRGRLRARG
ncbi:MAG: hypothetical protein CMH83_04870 [Nocardioides sp.]|nr:hypothetical protein [Nocardioides sp.]